MSETALTLITDALLEIGVLAEDETPDDGMKNHALRRLKYMLRQWSANNIRLYYTKQDTLTLTGATSYTIGSGGDCNTVRPTSIRGAYIDNDSEVFIISESKYRSFRTKDITGAASYLWYSPEYPLGKIYLFPTGGTTLYLDSLKPLSEPSAITDDISFPPEYDQAIVCGLAIRLAPTYGKVSSEETRQLALESLRILEVKNFSEQLNSVFVDPIKFDHLRYYIDEG